MDVIKNFSKVEEKLKSPKFLITEVNTSYNKGDSAIVLGILKIIRNKYPDSTITVLTPTPSEDIKYYSRYGAKTHIQLYDIIGKKFPRIIYLIFYLLKMSFLFIRINFRFLPVTKKDKNIIGLYRQADLVISCSGGRLGGKKISSIFNSIIPIYFAKKLGKKVFVCAQSIEPFESNFLKYLTRFILNRVDYITVREEISSDIIESLNIKTPNDLTADLSFLLDSDSKETGKSLLIKEGIPMNDKLRIGITITKWRISDSKLELKNNQLVNIIKDTIDSLVKENNAIIIFFPQVIIPNSEDDRLLSIEIKNKNASSQSKNIFVLSENYSPHQLKAMMGNMDLFIGKRLHSCIFALSMYVPTIIIGYEKKALGIMKMLGYEKFILDVNSLSKAKLVSLVKKLLSEREIIRKYLMQKIPVLQHAAKRNGEFLEILLKNNIKN